MLQALKKAIKRCLKKEHPNLKDILAEQIAILSAHPQFLHLQWELIEDNPVTRVEPACVTIENRLYVMAGYHTLNEVISVIDILDLKTGKWIERMEMPSYVSQTHQGVVCEAERYIYNITGQVGIQCSHSTVNCYVLDVQTRQWSTLPPLPKARYAPVTRLWNGRIHVLAGSKEDRVTPAYEHWSLAVKDGKALENQWREEPAIPRGGPHRCSAVIGDQLFVLGGQEGDRPRIAGDPNCKCDWTAPDEIFYKDSFALRQGERTWRRLADIPISVTHSEYSTMVFDKSIIILGGLMDNRMMSNLIQVYNTVTNSWKIVGKMPTRNKGCAMGYYDGWLYLIAGQKEAGPLNPTFGEVLKCGWRTKFPIEKL